ncbi:MAG: aldehyde dehydrogenase family protein, partial [Rhodospirillaceae bacterium]
MTVKTPINGAAIATVATTSSEDLQVMLGRSKDAFAQWRQLPPPRRGELVRLLGEELRAAKEPLARLVTLEAGKILSEGAGEVQEMIDICDFAVGLSRQLYGKAIASERPGHHMIERWHPLGPVGVISAFNFPVAVWSWNATLALVCGNSLVWKPSDLTPLTALACQALLRRAMERFGDDAPPDLLQVVIGGQELGAQLAAAPELPLVSATGSTRMGRAVGPIVTGRFGRVLLELGGNNAAVIAPSADLDLAVRAVTFSAVGTCGQRCTSLRRLIVHRSVHEAMVERLKPVYAGLPIGSPLQDGTLVGPLISEAAGAAMDAALDQARAEGGTVHGGGPVAGLPPDLAGGCYRAPALVEMPGQTELVRTETFAPILYVLAYDSLDEAIALNNGVPQGLSSCIFANDLREAETFLSAVGSDCGIANVNIGPSGAEIGGAFGGEKETGGGREAGSDAWQAYMRRQTQTVNYSTALPLAQGVKF